MNGALLVHKHPGVSSFGVIEHLQREWMKNYQIKKQDVPKMGHGGTLDPFATGLLVVLFGRGVKLARYFLGSAKSYEGVMRFGETTIPGDPTAPISEVSNILPQSLNQLQILAHSLTLQPYFQTPPMHSAKKQNGKPLYQLARSGIEVDRKAQLCQLMRFEISEYSAPRASFKIQCSSGTYIRTLTQDFAKTIGSVALLDSLHRTASGIFKIQDAWTMDQLSEALQADKKWNELPCWIPFHSLLQNYPRAEATPEEKLALFQGKQAYLLPILEKSNAHSNCIAIYSQNELIAIARKAGETWGIERVFIH